MSKKSPRALGDFIGNSHIRDHLQNLSALIKSNPDNISHTVFHGLPGTGKTTLVRLFAKEINFTLVELIGGNIGTSYLIPYLFKKHKGKTIVFIDEVHALKPSFQEELYPIMSDKAIENRSLADCAIFAATTNISKLVKPFHDRFVYNYEMSEYNLTELQSIVRSGFPCIPEELALEIANRSQTIPRVALNIAEVSADFCKIRASKRVNEKDVDSAFSLLKIGKSGVTQKQLKVLQVLTDSGGSGSKNFIVSSLGTTQGEYETIIEPFLIRKQFITVTRSGRSITENGLNFLESL